MKVAETSKPGGNFEVVEREIRQPGGGQVHVKLEARGICHSDPYGKTHARNLDIKSPIYEYLSLKSA